LDLELQFDSPGWEFNGVQVELIDKRGDYTGSVRTYLDSPSRFDHAGSLFVLIGCRGGETYTIYGLGMVGGCLNPLGDWLIVKSLLFGHVCGSFR
jgi:hypothetical protein